MAPADRQPDVRLDVVVAAPDGAVPATRGLGRWLAGAAPGQARGEVTVAVISDGRMRSLNRTYRGQDYAADVLSFPVRAAGADASGLRTGRAEPSGWAASFLGDIVIAAGVAARQARLARHSLGTELRVLALHGLLHLLGYDHETDTGEMARVEARLRRKGRLPDGLLERSPKYSQARARTRQKANSHQRKAR